MPPTQKLWILADKTTLSLAKTNEGAFQTHAGLVLYLLGKQKQACNREACLEERKMLRLVRPSRGRGCNERRQFAGACRRAKALPTRSCGRLPWGR